MNQSKTDNALLQAVIEIAERAGQAILEVYESDEFGVETKADESPLTRADMAAHRCIVAGLEALAQDWPILSEESAKVPFAERRTWQTYWLVDPLDGTREFIKRNGEFTVNIALIDQGVPIMGVVLAPVLDWCYFGRLGHGAWKRSGSDAAEPITVCVPTARPIRIAGSRSHSNERMQNFLERIGDYELRPMGSSLKSCLVAEGAADLYPRIGPTSEWDTAAAQAVVEAAGGQVTDANGQPLRYNQESSLLNPDFFVYGDPALDWSSCITDAVLAR